MVRFDAAHGGHPDARVPHINIPPRMNPRLRADPHLPIPSGKAGLQVSDYNWSVYYSIPLRFGALRYRYNDSFLPQVIITGMRRF